MNCFFLNIKQLGLFLILCSLVVLTQIGSSKHISSSPNSIFIACADSVQIDSVYAENCTGSGPYTADWKIIVSYTGLGDNITYQRNGEPTQTYTPSSLVDTLTLTNIPADGGAFDTLKVWYGNTQTCGDTILIFRPIPCSSNNGIPCTNLVTQAEDGVYSGNIQTDDNHLGFNGTGFANYPGEIGSDVKITWTENTPISDSANMVIRYALAGVARPLKLYVNGVFVVTYALNSTGGWTNYGTESHSIALNQGINTFELKADASSQGPNVDEFFLDICSFLSHCDKLQNTEIGGTIWQDDNFNGVMDEPILDGITSIQVIAYDTDNAIVGTGYSDTDGAFLLTGLTTGETYRIEYIIPDALADTLTTTPFSSENGTLVRFIQPGSCADLGLGNLMKLSTTPPLEIGNYIWEDTNKDGLQNAAEPPIDSVIVHLYNDLGELVGVDTTDSSGQYLFNDSIINQYTAHPDMTLQAATTYYIALIGTINSMMTNNILETNGTALQLTNKDATLIGHHDSNQIDSDGQIGGITSSITALDGFPFIEVVTDIANPVVHNFDFGFKPIEFDYGDLPDSTSTTNNTRDYQTLKANGGPSHLIIEGLLLGVSIDMDADGIPENLAMGDDLDNEDDEDGLSILSSMDARPGGTIRLPLNVTNTTGDTAYIRAWVDWNGDGDFDNLNELATTIKDDANGVFLPYLEINIADDAVINQLLGLRVRLSNEPNLDALGPAYSGEVEDYLLGVECPQAICLPIQTALIQN